MTRGDPQVAQARAVLAAAIEAGTWPAAAKCCACGAEQHTTANGRQHVVWHHPNGYENPWDVVELCRPCHSKTHQGLMPDPGSGRTWPAPDRSHGRGGVGPLPAILSKKLTVSPAQLARRLGVGRPVVANWMSGLAVPRPKKVAALCGALGLTTPAEVRELYTACRVPLPDLLFAPRAAS